jgi:hypothetical protein
MMQYFNNPRAQFFGAENPYNNPYFQTYQGGRPMLMALGNLPPSAAEKGTGPIGNKTGQDYDYREEGTQGPGDPSGAFKKDGTFEEDTSTKPAPKSQRDGDRDLYAELLEKLLEQQRYESDPDRMKEKFDITEPIYVRRAQLNQKMGLENLEAAGKASFKYKTGPQMFMTVGASKAAYLPEAVSAASNSFTGLNLANAMKPRMSGYYRGLV